MNGPQHREGSGVTDLEALAYAKTYFAVILALIVVLAFIVIWIAPIHHSSGVSSHVKGMQILFTGKTVDA